MRRIACELARHLQVVGPLNIQFAVHGSRVYVIEANPRASRTVPFVSKATGVALAKAAARLMCGAKLADLGLPPDDAPHTRYCVKEAVMPFGRFPGSDVVLGPEMKSTGEVMGIGRTFPEAYLKTQVAVGYELPQPGEHPLAFISVNDNDKRAIGSVAFALHGLGFRLAATAGTARVLRALGLACAVVRPASDAGLAKWGAEAADAPRITDLIAAGDVKLIINTPSGEGPHSDGFVLRTAAVAHGLTYVTTLQAAQAFAIGLEALAEGRGPEIVALQDLDKDRNEGETR